jgi:hypothetical protein
MGDTARRGVGSLADDLTATDTHSFSELSDLAIRSIREVGIDRASHVAARTPGMEHYWLLSFPANPTKKVRPVNSKLFLFDDAALRSSSGTLADLLDHVGKTRQNNTAQTKWSKFLSENGLTRTLYTIQQSISLALDYTLTDNQARKRAGQYFEDLISSLLLLLGLESRRANFRIPVPGLRPQTFNIEVDRVFNTNGPVKSTPSRIDPGDILLSAKTSSKDRYSKLLVDKMIAEKIANSPMKLVAVFHNDVQRTESDGVSVTFLAQQYLVYTTYLSSPSGVYYVDPPSHGLRSPWNATVKPIDQLFVKDLWVL